MSIYCIYCVISSIDLRVRVECFGGGDGLLLWMLIIDFVDFVNLCIVLII